MYKDFNDQLEQLAEKEDINELNKLVDSLPAEDVEKHREDIVNAYMSIYQTWAFDLDCGKMPDVEGAVGYMLEIVSKLEEIDPGKKYNSERGICYEHMAEFKTTREEKIAYIDKAIHEYASLYPRLANARLAKMEINDEFPDKEYEDILEIVLKGLKDEDAVSSYLYTSLNIKDQYWSDIYYNRISDVLKEIVVQTPSLKLVWIDVLERKDAKHGQLIEILETLTDYKTDNQNILNKLGQAFEKAAKRTNNLRYYQYACEYYIQGHYINPAAWTFPVYATNMIKQIVRFDNQPVIALYKKGQALFANVHEPEKDFTLNSYWCEYLLDYARVAYQFKAPELLQQAAEKATLALQLGNGFYSSPYQTLAKATLKLGDKKRCIEILKACQQQFTSEWSAYTFEKELEDEEFRDIWEEIR